MRRFLSGLVLAVASLVLAGCFVSENSLIGPGIVNWDFSTSKELHVSETNYIQLRFEAFNFLNHPNWGDPNTTFNSVAFGTINSTRTEMRQLQFGLKFVF